MIYVKSEVLQVIVKHVFLHISFTVSKTVKIHKTIRKMKMNKIIRKM